MGQDAYEPLTYEVLAALGTEPDRRLSMTRLVNVVGISSGGMTKLVDRATSKGLVDRDYSTTDRRVVYAVLTQQGEACHAAATAEYADRVRQELQALSSARWRQLNEIAAALAAE